MNLADDGCSDVSSLLMLAPVDSLLIDGANLDLPTSSEVTFWKIGRSAFKFACMLSCRLLMYVFFRIRKLFCA